MTKSDYMMIRLPPALKRTLKMQAAKEQRTLAGQVLSLIEAALAAREREAFRES